MKLTNNTIYTLAISQEFEDFKSYIPAKANFAIQKNFSAIANAAKEIDKARIEVIKHYGVEDETDGKYTIPQENLEKANQELLELFELEQELDIRTFTIEDLGSAEFTPAQMQTIMFMIEEWPLRLPLSF